MLLQAAPVWEITGAEFSSSNIHTASGISIRFPRVTRIRDDKDWSNATDLERLKVSLGCRVTKYVFKSAIVGFVQDIKGKYRLEGV